MKQIISTHNIIIATGRNSDFPLLSESKALAVKWDGRKDVHPDYLEVRS